MKTPRPEKTILIARLLNIIVLRLVPTFVITVLITAITAAIEAEVETVVAHHRKRNGEVEVRTEVEEKVIDRSDVVDNSRV